MKKAKKKTSSSGNGTIDVKIAQLGTSVIEVTIKKGETVEDALEAAGVSTKGVIKCAGREVDLSDQPDHGDRLTISDQVKGA